MSDRDMSSNERSLILARFIRNQVALADRPPPGRIQLNNDEALLCAEALERGAGETAVVPPKVVHAICHAACGDCVMQTDPTRPPCDVSNCTVMQAVHAFRFHLKSERETAAEPPLAEMTDAERLANYVRAFENLKTKSPKELVELVLEHVIDLKPFHELLVEELCSRVYPGWENDDSKSTLAPLPQMVAQQAERTRNQLEAEHSHRCLAMTDETAVTPYVCPECKIEAGFHELTCSRWKTEPQS